MRKLPVDLPFFVGDAISSFSRFVHSAKMAMGALIAKFAARRDLHEENARQAGSSGMLRRHLGLFLLSSPV